MIDVWRWHNNTLAPVRLASPAATLNDATRQLPHGAYTTFRTYHNRACVIGLRDHLQRLATSARALGWRGAWDETALRTALVQALAAFQAPEARVRLVLDTTRCPGDLYIVLEPLHPLPREVYEQGVATITHHLVRHAPNTKTTDFLAQQELLRRTMPPGVFEVLLTDAEGCILEGSSSNFFAVADGLLITAPDETVLKGITRSRVLALAQEEGVPVHFAPVCPPFERLDEAFITSSSRGVVPVVRIDDTIIGGGVPGRLTHRLHTAYNAYIARWCEPIAPNPR
ncbi:branched-chain amino acid aminotransferase [Ardenticatena maritima]|uniref:Branched-chain amino acid aminotransferase n=1 Tax=Ardenticatena maritima TaxID=872965 RepID=A0A0M9UCR7_9CHLR|nr:aminotransferase class IV [Ardenticatena maritima]GAP63237.1 branched-chain amino acid aminotransferase [Ardenticatena maritima]